MEVEISITEDKWLESTSPHRLVSEAIAGTKKFVQELDDDLEVSLLFCNDEFMRILNAQWRGIDKATNVLSFPASEQPDSDGMKILGDIAIAFETCEREAQDARIPFPHHVIHLIVHGMLHLLKYDHETEEEAEIMEEMERQILQGLKLHDPYG